MPKIKLKSSDGEIMEIDEQAAKSSATLKTMLEVCDKDAVIPLPNVSAAILNKVVQWLDHHKDDPPSQEDDSNDIPKWGDDLAQETLSQLIAVGKCLNTKSLTDAAKTVLAYQGVSAEAEAES